MIYLDFAATTPIRREVMEAMWPYLTAEFGNPSSSHSAGERAARALKQARADVAEALGCRAGEVIFTGGGTEGDNLAVKGIALGAVTSATLRGRHIVTTPIEHEAVLESCDYLRRLHGFEITYVPVDRFGMVDPGEFAASLRDDTTLATVMLANNEVGTIQPVAELAALARARGIPFHTDGVQAAGALDLRPVVTAVDALTISGHKLGAPKGVGALYLRGGVAVEPLLHGGGQERGRRSGTEDVAAAVALATALKLATSELASNTAHLREMQAELIRGVQSKIPTAILTGHPTQRLPGNVSFCFPDVSGEAMLLALEERGVQCSSGSACAAGRDEPSHVLLAMGYSREIAQTAVRFSFGPSVTTAEVYELLEVITAARTALSTK